jgi:AcrR family transcriptional regulator
MARPIETADDELLDAADAVLMANGPAEFTLARAADAAGVSAATLVKRFGSKERLFLRLSQRWVASLDEQLRARAARYETPLARFEAVALHSYHDLDRPATAHNQIAVLAVDLQHDELRGGLHAGWQLVRRHLARHASDAISAGQLVGCPPPDQLARIVAGAMEGGAIAWSVHPERSLVQRLDDDLTALLSGWTRDE